MVEEIRLLINSLSEKHFDLVCDLWNKLLGIERQDLFFSFTELPAKADPECISPEWEEIGLYQFFEQKHFEQKHSLQLTRDFLRLCKSKRNSKIRVKRKKGSKSILDVLEQYNVKIKSRMILCPFHADTHPSCRIYPETDTFYCFGCGKYGTATELEEKLKEVQL